MVYDLIILGAGPAGIAASVYAARKRVNFIVISKDVGGQTLWTADIENYIGYQFITGVDLVDKFSEHLKKYNVELKEEEVMRVAKNNSIINVVTNKGEYEAKTLIVATGRIPRKLGVEGEEDFIGKGITYCATCDAPLFSDKDVAVIGGGNSAIGAVLQLTRIANKIYVVDMASELRADPIMVEKARESEKVVFYNNAKVEKLSGDKFVDGITISHQEKTWNLSVGGVFVEIGSIPASGFMGDIQKNESSEVIVNCQTKTSVSGIFAAGDVTDVYAKQIIVACGEGAKAALASFEYLNRVA